MPGPLQPSYVLRGHTSAIHAVRFLRSNTRLLTGDASGVVILWSLATFRPVAVWAAHSNAILALGAWGDDKILTHGRDQKLCAWSLPEEAESGLSAVLPVDGDVGVQMKPWLLHSLAVNTLNFCGYASCPGTNDSVLVALPGARDGTIVVYELPGETMHSLIEVPAHAKAGMPMALDIARTNDDLVLVAGFEIGLTIAWRYAPGGWHQTHSSSARTQPVLSVAIAPHADYFYSSGADAAVSRHDINGKGTEVTPTKHAGQQGLTIRSDGKVMATAGWDGRARVYSVRTMEEKAVLAWHKEGCYTVGFAEVLESSDSEQRLTVAQRREAKVRNTHWLALGSKDGKISLWEVF